MYLHLIREAKSKGKGGRSGCKPFCTADSACRYSYAFDDIGNRESSSERGTNSVYAANNLNQYTAITDVAAAPTPSQTFNPQFDDDGNQTLIKTSTGVWQVQYNGENRPVLWECVSPNSSTPTLLSMSFDRMGRRVTKIGIGPFAAGFGWDGIFPDSREVATLREEFTKTCCCGVK